MQSILTILIRFMGLDASLKNILKLFMIIDPHEIGESIVLVDPKTKCTQLQIALWAHVLDI